MKKRKVLSVGLLACVFAFVSLCSCARGEIKVSPSGFEGPLEKAGYTVTDITTQVETDGLAITVLDVEDAVDMFRYFETPNDEMGKKLFDLFYEELCTEHPERTVVEEISDEEKQYDYYAFETKERVYVISRIRNTLIRGEAVPEDYEELFDLFDIMKY